MEEIKIKYSKDIDIEKYVMKIIENTISKDNYEYKIVFIDDEGKTFKDYEELQSYKLLCENIEKLVEKIKKEKIEFKMLGDKIKEFYKQGK